MKIKIIFSMAITLIMVSFLSHTLFVNNSPMLNRYFARDIVNYLAFLGRDVQIAFQKFAPIGSSPISYSIQVDPDIAAVHSGGTTSLASRPKILSTLVYAADQQEVQMNTIPQNMQKDVFLEQGFAYQAAGMLDKAAEKYNAAIQKDPQDPLTYIRLASVYLDKQDVDQAIVIYQKALQVRPDNEAVVLELAKTYQYKKSQPNIAAKIYEQEVAKKPNDQYLKLLLVVAYIDAGRKTDAKYVLMQILQSDPKNQTAQQRLDSLEK